MSYRDIREYECDLCEIVEKTDNETEQAPRDWVHVEWSVSSADSRMGHASDPFDFCPKCAFLVKSTMESKGG